MKKLIAAIMIQTLMATAVSAFDMTDKKAVGLTGGYAFPVGGEAFKKEADGGGAYGAYFRKHFGPNWGMDAAYTKQHYSKICSCTDSDIFDVMGFYRLKGVEDMTPVFGLGLGVADNGPHQNLHLGVRARVGITKAYNEKIDMGFMVDYQSISKMIGASKGPVPGNISTITPKIEFSWYFGN